MAGSEDITLKYKGLRFLMPSQTGFFEPYYGICFCGVYDPLLNGIKKGDIVLDAGAYIDIFSLLASRKCSRVIAVEPDPENYSYLIKNIALNKVKNVTPVNIALSNYVGKGYVAGKGPLTALSRNGTLVRVTTIDRLLRLRGLDLKEVNVVKMDIEGSEAEALNGDYLSKVRAIMVETHSKEILKKVYEILERKSFQVNEWRFSLFKTLRRILGSIDFFDTELRTGFKASKLFLQYIIGLSPHPIPAAVTDSEIKLIFAIRRL